MKGIWCLDESSQSLFGCHMETAQVVVRVFPKCPRSRNPRFYVRVSSLRCFASAQTPWGTCTRRSRLQLLNRVTRCVSVQHSRRGPLLSHRNRHRLSMWGYERHSQHRRANGESRLFINLRPCRISSTLERGGANFRPQTR